MEGGPGGTALEDRPTVLRECPLIGARVVDAPEVCAMAVLMSKGSE